MNQSHWATNIRFLRNRKKYSQEELAEHLGISRVKLNAHENGHTRNPPVDDLIRFSSFFHLSIDTLLKVELPTLSELRLRELEAGNDAFATGSQIRVLATTVDSSNKNNVEQVPVRARAGYTAGYGDPEFIAQLPVFHLPQLPAGRKYRMFPISGDSMLPVPDGAYVIAEYSEDWTSVKSGTPCIVVTREEGIVFKIVRNQLKEQRSLKLESLNAQYAPYEVPARDVLELWTFRSFISEMLPEPETPVHSIARTVEEIRADLKRLMKGK